MAESKSAQQVREITDKLEQGIKELFESERFKEYLRRMSKFYHYSFSNTLLIAMQKPEATYVEDAGTAIYDTIPKKPAARESIRDKLKSAQKAQPTHTPKPQKSKGKDMVL